MSKEVLQLPLRNEELYNENWDQNDLADLATLTGKYYANDKYYTSWIKRNAPQFQVVKVLCRDCDGAGKAFDGETWEECVTCNGKAMRTAFYDAELERVGTLPELYFMVVERGDS